MYVDHINNLKDSKTFIFNICIKITKSTSIYIFLLYFLRCFLFCLSFIFIIFLLILFLFDFYTFSFFPLRFLDVCVYRKNVSVCFLYMSIFLHSFLKMFYYFVRFFLLHILLKVCFVLLVLVLNMTVAVVA